jgi:hemoglobin
MKHDIENIEDVKLLVNTFYQRIQAHELLGPVFASKIQDWTPHLEKMYRFWQTLLLETHTYFGSPFPPHAHLPVGKEHFDEWLKLWKGTVDEFYEGEKASDAKWRAEKMAHLFHHKIEYYKSHPESKPLV